MRNIVLCNNIDCLEWIELEEYDISESNEDDILDVVECPYCHHMNAVTYYLSVNYQSQDATNKDIEEFKNF